MRDHPGDFNNKVGDDLYLNPWWALRDGSMGWRACGLAADLTATLGEPDLWFTGLFHELLWGPREFPRLWRPGFHANLSGPQGGVIWRNFWLPWRIWSLDTNVRAAASALVDERPDFVPAILPSGVPYACNVTAQEVTNEDLGNVIVYTHPLTQDRIRALLRRYSLEVG